MNVQVKPPFIVLPDVDGNPIDAGSVYIGEAGLDPEVNPISVYWDDALTIPAAQPIATINGFLSRAGSPANAFIATDYSITVRNKNGSLVYTSLSNLVSIPAFNVDGVIYDGGVVATAKADIHAKIGDRIVTSGYVTPGDGGGNEYEYVAAATGVDDGGSYIDAPGSGLQLKGLFPGGIVRAEQFGAVSETSDTSVGFSAAFAYAYAQGISTVHFVGKRGVSNTILAKVNVSLKGDGRYSEIIPLGGATFTNGFIFYINTDNGTDVLEEFPMKTPGKFSGFHVNNAVNSVAGVRMALFHGGYQFKDIMLTGMAQMLSKMAFYADFVTIEHVHYRQPSDQTTYYAIDMQPGLGDGFYINKIDFPEFGGGETKGIRTGQSIGGIIENVMNGIHYIDNTKAVQFIGGHIEGGNITVDRSSVDFWGMVIYNEDDATPPVKLVDTGADVTVRHSVAFRDVRFLVSSALGGNPGSADIWVHPKYNVDIENCYRLINQSGVISKSSLHGIIVADSAGVDIDDFNNYSHILSRKCSIVSEVPQHSTKIDNRNAGAVDGIAAASSTTSAWSFSGATNTYYYKAQLLLDPVRLIGKTGGVEKSLSLTNGGDAPNLLLSLGGYTPMCMVRLYRGTATNSYDNYVDIPIIQCRVLVDEGSEVNGFPWIARAAGAVDSINAGFDESFAYSAGTAIFEIVGVIPTVGTFKQGDQLIKLNATVDGNGMLNREVNRITSGSGHVTGTDWVRGYISTVTPAT
jgi:hypothetical protein